MSKPKNTIRNTTAPLRTNQWLIEEEKDILDRALCNKSEEACLSTSQLKQSHHREKPQDLRRLPTFTDDERLFVAKAQENIKSTLRSKLTALWRDSDSPFPLHYYPSEISEWITAEASEYAKLTPTHAETDCWLEDLSKRARETFTSYFDDGFHPESVVNGWIAFSIEQHRQLIPYEIDQRKNYKEPPPIPQAWSLNIKGLREYLGYSVLDLVEKLGGEERRVREHEKGIHKPELSKLRAYADLFSRELDAKIFPGDLLVEGFSDTFLEKKR